MRKRTILATFTASLLTCALSAQMVKSSDTVTTKFEKKQYKTTYEKDRFIDNLVFSLGGGGQIISASDNDRAKFQDRITFAPTFSVAKYFSPTWGLRLQFLGGTLHGFNDGENGTYTKWNSGSTNYMGEGYALGPGPKGHGGNPAVMGPNGYPAGVSSAMFTWDPQWNYMGFTINNPDPKKNIIYDTGDNTYRWQGADLKMLYMQHVNYIATNFDFMLNLVTLINGYNPNRVIEITPFAGIGWYHAMPNLGAIAYNGAGVNAGADLKVQFSKHLGAFGEVNGVMVPNGFDGQVGGTQTFEAITQVTGGISYTIGNQGWRVSDPMDYQMVDNLNQQINDLRAELNKPRPETPPCPVVTPPTAPKKEIRFLPNPVFFRIDKSIIDDKEYSKIEQAADYLSKHPQENVVVTGYADRQTANPAYNLKLSERRAKAVSQVLIEKYGINPLRVSVDWSGDEIQPFKINNWNRVAIFVLRNHTTGE